jgi:hypothetical protein
MISLGKRVTRLFGKGDSRRKIALDEPVDEEITRLRQLLENNRSAEAFARLNQIKAAGQPVRNVDYLRACFFLGQEQIPATIEALKEELRWFPDNLRATEMFESISPSGQSTKNPGGDLERLIMAVRPYTMLSELRLKSLYDLAREVCETGISGNFVECGVAGGGSSGLLAAVIAKYPAQSRLLFSFDTFSGMPASTDFDTHEGQQAEATGWGTGTCAAPESSLLEICQKLGVRQVVRPIKGLFNDTLPAHRGEIGPIALLHMDSDWYSSTRDILENFYDAVVPGGRIQVDDYGFWDGCRRAVTEFAERRGLNLQINRIDESGIWIVK